MKTYTTVKGQVVIPVKYAANTALKKVQKLFGSMQRMEFLCAQSRVSSYVICAVRLKARMLSKCCLMNAKRIKRKENNAH